MPRPIITKHELELAHRQNEKSFVLPENSIVTDAARDAAKDFGITMICASEASKNSQSQIQIIKGYEKNRNIQKAENREEDKEGVKYSAEKAIDLIKKEIINELSAENYPEEILNEIIKRTLEAYSLNKNTELKSNFNENKSSREDGKILANNNYTNTSFEGGIYLNSKKLLENKKEAPCGDLICLTSGLNYEDKSSFCLDYFSWDKGNFLYESEDNIVLIVLDGTIKADIKDLTLNLNTHDTLVLEKGSEVKFSVDTFVQCMTVLTKNN